MKFEEIDLSEMPKQPNSWFPGKNILGAAQNVAENIGEATKAGLDPLRYGINKAKNFFGNKPEQTSHRIKALEPSHQGEEYAQHLLANTGLGGITSGFSPKNLAHIGKNVIASDIGQQVAKSLGAGSLGQFAASVATPVALESMRPSQVQEYFQPLKKSLYSLVKSEGKKKISAGDINNLTQEFLEEAQRIAAKEGDFSYIKYLEDWNNKSKNGEISGKDLHTMKKDINRLIYKKYGSPSYLKAFETAVYDQIEHAKKPSSPGKLTNPVWAYNLRKADRLHTILSDFAPDNKIVKYVSDFIKKVPLAGNAIIKTGETTRSVGNQFNLLGSAPKETLSYYAQNLVKMFEDNPSIFKSQIEHINKLLNKDVMSKDHKFEEVDI